VHDKLVRRHPHVFGDTEVAGTGEVLANWDAIKQAEKQRTSVFDGLAAALPALALALKVQKKAAKLGFDWPDVHGALPKITEEVDEVLVASEAGDTDAVEGEIGDLLFAVVNVARHLDIEPETALRRAIAEFRTRFEHVERTARERDIDLRSSDLATLLALWDEAKRPR